MTLQLHEAKPKTSAYWRSPEGMMRRIEILSQNFTYKVVNNSLMFYGYSAGIKLVRWVTRGDERVCPICGPYEGRIYRKGQFLPPLPAHASCRCGWELIVRREEEIEFEAVDISKRPVIRDPYKSKSYQHQYVNVKDLKVARVGNTDITLINKPTKKFTKSVTDTLEKIPFDYHSRHLREIKIINVPARKVKRGSRTGVVNGFHEQKAIYSSITVYAKGPHPERTLLHEIGHNVYHNVLMERAKWDWDNEFYPSLEGYELPSDYAERNASEGFAESYAHYYTEGAVLDTKVKTWLEDRVGLEAGGK